MQYLQVGENDRLKRRIYFFLVDGTDGITPVTTEAGGTAKVSLNGNPPTTSVNSLVAIDTTNQPGTYYLELSTTEIQFPGIVIVRYKSSATAEFVALGQIMAFDPYTQVGSLGNGGGSDVDYKRIAKIVAEEVSKVEMPEIPEAPEFDYETLQKGFESVISRIEGKEIPETDLKPVLSQLESIQSNIKAIKIPETDFNPVLERIDTVISITEDLLADSKDENTKEIAAIKETIATEIAKVCDGMDGLNSRIDNSPVLVMKDKKEEPKESSIQDYLNLPE